MESSSQALMFLCMSRNCHWMSDFDLGLVLFFVADNNNNDNDNGGDNNNNPPNP